MEPLTVADVRLGRAMPRSDEENFQDNTAAAQKAATAISTDWAHSNPNTSAWESGFDGH